MSKLFFDFYPKTQKPRNETDRTEGPEALWRSCARMPAEKGLAKRSTARHEARKREGKRPRCGKEGAGRAFKGGRHGRPQPGRKRRLNSFGARPGPGPSRYRAGTVSPLAGRAERERPSSPSSVTSQKVRANWKLPKTTQTHGCLPSQGMTGSPRALAFRAKREIPRVQRDPSRTVGMTGIEQRDPSVPWDFLLAPVEAGTQE